MSAAARPAAPPPTITIDGGWPAASPDRGTGGSVTGFRSRTKTRPSRSSTRQHERGSNAGARTGFAGLQVKTRVMQGAANRAVDDQSFGQRSMVVRAVRSHGEPSIAVAHQQDVVIACFSFQALAIPQRVGGHAGDQVNGDLRHSSCAPFLRPRRSSSGQNGFFGNAQ